MYTRILVPMENEEYQEPALAHACTLAQQTGAAVVLVWLVPVAASGEEYFFKQLQVEPGSSGERRKARGKEYLIRATKPFRAAGVDIVSEIEVTPLPPEQAIVELAAEKNADLVIMATLPQSAVGRFLFGSVGEKVRRRSPVPVLFIPPPQDREGVE